jgi:cytochrome P450
MSSLVARRSLRDLRLAGREPVHPSPLGHVSFPDGEPANLSNQPARRLRIVGMTAFPYPAPKADPATPSGLLYHDHEPISRVSFPSGHEGWLLTRHADARLVLSDPRFSRYLLYPGAPCMIEPGDFSTGERSILNLDPPDHTRLRRLTAQTFTARRIEELRPRIQQITDELLDAMAGRTPPVDLIEEFAFPLPTAVICEVLGVPFADRDRFRAWSTTIVTPMQHTPDEVTAAQEQGAADMRALVESKRAEPGGDLLSELVQARDDDDRLTEDELIDLATQMLLAGHETTVSLIGTAVVLLCRHPEQLAALRADPGLLAGAIEETMRYDGPADGGLLRVAREDVTIGEVTIKKGDGVLPMSSAANFDEEVFAEPERFDITRAQNPHLGFGHGMHFCLGAALARLEGQVALRSLLDRFPTLRLAVGQDEIGWRPPLSVRGPVAVPVTWG